LEAGRDGRRRANIDFDAIIEEVCSSGGRRIYAVKKVLRVFEEGVGMRIEDTIPLMLDGEMDVYNALRRFGIKA